MTTRFMRKAPAFLSRRGLVVGGAIAAACAPFLRPLRALASPRPARRRRVLFWYKPFGNNEATWFPARPGPYEGPDALPSALAPLAPYHARVLQLDGVDLRSAIEGEPLDIPAHSREVLHVWTGIRACRARPGATFSEARGGEWGWAGGPSIDQYLAAQPFVRGGAPLASLDLGVGTDGSRQVHKHRMSFGAADRPVTPRSDPHAVFEDLFGQLAGSREAQARRRQIRSHILDNVRHELRGLRGHVAPADRPTLDAHVATVESLDKMLAQRVSPLMRGVCAARPDLGERVDPGRNDTYPIVTDQHVGLLAAAFACDFTRVGTLLMGGQLTVTWLPGVTSETSYHTLSHMHMGPSKARPMLTRIDQWLTGRFRFFLDRLAALDPTGGLGLLDDTMIVYGNEHQNGLHDRRRIPFTIINGLGHLRTGRAVKFDRAPHNNLLVSVAQAMGANISTFGDPAYCAGPLAGLTVG